MTHCLYHRKGDYET